jgi:hypothetical protein
LRPPLRAAGRGRSAQASPCIMRAACSQQIAIVVRLVVDLQREQHWREAAVENDQELDRWIADVLDREAAAILERSSVGAAV